MERYSYQNGAFCAPDGQTVALANIPGYVAVSFPECERYINASRLQNPALFDSLIASCRSDDTKAFFEDERAFVTELLESQP